MRRCIVAQPQCDKVHGGLNVCNGQSWPENAMQATVSSPKTRKSFPDEFMCSNNRTQLNINVKLTLKHHPKC